MDRKILQDLRPIPTRVAYTLTFRPPSLDNELKVDVNVLRGWSSLGRVATSTVTPPGKRIFYHTKRQGVSMGRNAAIAPKVGMLITPANVTTLGNRLKT